MIMYCNSLKCIFQHVDSRKYSIDMSVLKNLDFFIKNKTTTLERLRINPIKFSIEMNIPETTALMTFIIGMKCGLFRTRAYINCYCDEQYEVENLLETIECYCGRKLIPNEIRDKVFLFFELIETPSDCECLEIKETQLDYLDGDCLGKRFVSLAELDSFIGKEKSNNLINQREDGLKQYLGR